MFVKVIKDYLNLKAGQIVDVADATQAQTIISGGYAEAVTSDPLGPVIAKGLENLLGSVTAGIDKAIESQLKAFADAMTKSRKNAVPAIFGANQKGDPQHTFGRFLLAVRHGDQKTLEEMGSHFVEWESNVARKADMTSNIGARGGFAVPTQFYDDIALRVKDMSIVRKRARIIDMTGRMVEIPTPNYTTAPSAGDTATLSGLVLRWTEEGAAVNQSEPTLRQLELTNYELSGYSKLSNSLLQDSPALETFLRSLFAEGVAWFEDYAFLRGDGVKKPLGAVTWVSNNSFTQSRSAASAFALADAAKLYGKLLRGMAMPGEITWAIHPTVVEKLLTMTGGDRLIFLNTARETPTWQILGHDVDVTEKLPALNTAGDVLFANWSHYYIGDRKQYEVAFSEHAGFTTNQTYFRVVSRVGGHPWIRDKMTLSDATSTLGSFVTLAAG